MVMSQCYPYESDSFSQHLNLAWTYESAYSIFTEVSAGALSGYEVNDKGIERRDGEMKYDSWCIFHVVYSMCWNAGT